MHCVLGRESPIFHLASGSRSLIWRKLKDPLIQGSMRQTLNIQLLCSWPHNGSMRRLHKPHEPEHFQVSTTWFRSLSFTGMGRHQGTTRCFMHGSFKNSERSKLLAATPWGPGRRQVHSLSMQCLWRMHKNTIAPTTHNLRLRQHVDSLMSSIPSGLKVGDPTMKSPILQSNRRHSIPLPSIQIERSNFSSMHFHGTGAFLPTQIQDCIPHHPAPWPTFFVHPRLASTSADSVLKICEHRGHSCRTLRMRRSEVPHTTKISASSPEVPGMLPHQNSFGFCNNKHNMLLLYLREPNAVSWAPPRPLPCPGLRLRSISHK